MKKAFVAAFYIMFMLCASAQNKGTVEDIDGNKYPTVLIGTQEWIAENLRTTRLNEGTMIPLVTNGNGWAGSNTAAYSWYDNNEKFKLPYGALYNWYTVGTGKLCPLGWHVPDESDWSELTAFLGGNILAGGKMKSTGREEAGRAEISSEQIEKDQPTYEPVEKRRAGYSVPVSDKRSMWNYPNTGAGNETRFSALPGGHRTNDNDYGVFARMGDYAYWWSATPSSPGVAWFRMVYYNYSNISKLTMGKTDGLSVRCVRD